MAELREALVQLEHADNRIANLKERIEVTEIALAAKDMRLDLAHKRIAELEAAGTWQIRGQPDSELVLVSVHFKHRAGPVWDYYRVLEARWQCGKGWREAGGLPIMGHRRVTHWRPLPNPVIPEATDERR